MPVILERQRLGQVFGQRFEAAEMLLPAGRVQVAEADPFRPTPIEEARNRFWKAGGRDGIVEIRAELKDFRIGSIGSRACH
jgi:hypothetical protein